MFSFDILSKIGYYIINLYRQNFFKTVIIFDKGRNLIYMKLKIMFLGGVGEIGKNMTVFEYGDEIVILDCGVSFPTSEMPGVDLVIPDMTYLKENKSKIKGVLLTHGHEDHIGGVPFLVKELGKTTLYGTRLTLALVGNKLREHNVEEMVTYKEVGDRTTVKLGKNFSIEFIHVSHSVAGSLAIAITTPVGVVFHTGDFKIDYTPLHGEIMNLTRIAEIGKKGVLCLMSESTNVERNGYTMSESVVAESLDSLFTENATRRILITTFSSNVDRLQQMFEIAKRHKRKVALSGRSMINVVDTAQKAGYLTVDKDWVVDINKIANIPDHNLVIFTTGSQGEPMSALTRMASGEFNKVTIGKNDTIILSSSPIPGNERDIYRVINNLYKLGATVVYSAIDEVHVSGHACKEELKLIYTLIKPKFFIPVHGEYRHLSQHASLVEQLGHKKGKIFIPEIGDQIELDSNKLIYKGKVPNGNILIDGLGVGDVGNSILKDRLALSEEGVIIVTAAVWAGKIVAQPQVITRGCFYAGDNTGGAVIDELKRLSTEALTNVMPKFEINAAKQAVIKQLRSYFKKNFQRFPMILPIIMVCDLDKTRI